MQDMGLKTSIMGKLRDRIEILSTQNLLWSAVCVSELSEICSVCQQTELPALLTFKKRCWTPFCFFHNSLK